MKKYRYMIYEPLEGRANRIRIRRVASQSGPVRTSVTKYSLVSDFPVKLKELEELTKIIHGWTSGHQLTVQKQRNKLGKNVLIWSEFND